MIFSLGLYGLGLCATQYASAWMTADIYRDGFHYHLDFKNGENVGGLHKEEFTGRRTGSVIRWLPGHRRLYRYRRFAGYLPRYAQAAGRRQRGHHARVQRPLGRTRRENVVLL